MAIALDGTTPAAVSVAGGATSTTSAAFSPPANSMIVVFVGIFATSSTIAQSVSGITNTGTALTWTKRVGSNHTGSAPGGAAEIWWAYNTSAQSGITVTASYAAPAGNASDPTDGVMAVKVFTGTATSLAAAAIATQVNTTAAVASASVTTTAANSWVWGVALDWSNATAPTATSGQTIVDSERDTTNGDQAWTQSQTAVTSASGTVVPISITAPTGLTQLVVIEILAATGGGSAPTVTGVSPSSGTTAGGTSVAITGTSFTGATAVKFGATNATSFTVNSATSITATAPAGSAGTVDITVTTPSGTSATSGADQFTYTAPGAPTVTGVSPNTGPTSGGGGSVAITGTGFTGATAVHFGAVGATFSVNSATSITAFLPAGSAGVVDVTVTTAGGTSATSSSDQFTYVVGLPTVTAVSPSSGSTAGGTSVGITGTGFSSATAVHFGLTAAIFTVNSSTSITATSPSGSAGTVDVTVINSAGTSPTGSADQFTFTAPPPGAPVVTEINPTAGTTLGGVVPVKIRGTSFTGATAVKFGAATATGLTVVSDSLVIATAPAHVAGTVDVTVTTSIGTSAAVAADQFLYMALPTGGLPALRLEMALTTDPYATPSWTEPLSSRGTRMVRSLKTSGVKRSEVLGRFDAGTAEATIQNQERRLEPLFSGSPYFPNLKMRKRVRYTAVGNSGTYPIQSGFLESLPPSFVALARDARVKLTSADAFKIFSTAAIDAPYPLLVIADGAAPYYRFQESAGPRAFDSSGSNIMGTYVLPTTFGGAGLVADDAATSMAPLPGDGTTQDYILSHPVASTAMARSISIVVQYPAFYLDNDGLWNSLPTGAAAPMALRVGGSGDQIVAALCGPNIIATPPSGLSDGLIHAIDVTVDSTGLGTLYLDGVVLGSVTGVGAPNYSTMNVGQQPHFGPYSIGEYHYYPGICLTAAQVAKHWDAAKNGWGAQTSDARVNALLDAFGWRSVDRDIDPGIATLTDMADGHGQKLMDQLRLVDATEGGVLVPNRNGDIMMRSRRAVQGLDPASPSFPRSSVVQAVFGDAGGSQIGWTDFTFAYDDLELYNDIEVTRRNGMLSIAKDRASIGAQGGAVQLQRQSIASNDFDAAGQAGWLLSLLKNPNRFRITGFTVPLTGVAAVEAAALGREVWDLVQFSFHPPGGGAAILQNVLITGIDHTVDEGGHWEVQFSVTGTDLQNSGTAMFIVGTSFVGSGDLVSF